MDQKEQWKNAMWNRLSRPLIWTGVCFFLGVLLPAMVSGSGGFYYRSGLDESMGTLLGSICGVARIALILYCPVSLYRAYKAAKLDVGSRTVLAEITEVHVSSITVNGSRTRTITCRAEGYEYSTKTKVEYGEEIIGWKVPVRISSYDRQMYEVMLDRMTKDYAPDLSGISDSMPSLEQPKDGTPPWESSGWDDSGAGDTWRYDWGREGEKGEDERLR